MIALYAGKLSKFDILLTIVIFNSNPQQLIDNTTVKHNRTYCKRRPCYKQATCFGSKGLYKKIKGSKKLLLHLCQRKALASPDSFSVVNCIKNVSLLYLKFYLLCF
jgi:hypothetical protein